MVNNENNGSDAFRIEYERNTRSESLHDEIESYLGEYRFNLQVFPYEVEFSPDPKTGKKWEVRDTHKKESLVDMADKAILRRQKEQRSIHRELAEKTGLTDLNIQLASAKTGDQIFWASPPGDKEEGYGTYGFIYAGQVTEVTGESGPFLKLNMNAIRVEEPTTEQFNNALSKLVGERSNKLSATQFLASPKVVSEKSIDYRQVIQKEFSFQIDPKQDFIFRKVMIELTPHINEFIDFVRQGLAKPELLKAFKGIENYAIELRKYYENKTDSNTNIVYLRKPEFMKNLEHIMSVYDYEPEFILGSCGSTDMRSANIFAKYSALAEALADYFNCPKCNESSPPPVGDSCPKCGYTKAQAMASGEQVC